MKYLLPFNDPLASRVEHSGGKGANLALLTQRGFPVPPGFIITAEAYRDFIHSGRELLARVHDLPFGDAQRLREESRILVQSLDQLSLPEALVFDIKTMLKQFGPRQAFSVRSSSTLEDLASAAFAGQHETYLNRTGEDDIIRSVKACFLSLWSDRAMAYRRQQGFDHFLAAMAVVVQEMIPCEVAGVGFSINPVTGDLNSMIVNSNFGLGESVVSGEGEIDQFEIDKATRQIKSSQIAAKSRKVICTDAGTQEVHLDAEEGRKPSLSAEQLSQFTDLLLKVETSFGFPQDIEWGFCDGKLHLLQSRPITTFPARWTRDESAERFPNVITPLTWDFVETGFHHSLAYSFRLMGFPPFGGKWFAMFNHYVYGNQTAVDLYLKRPPFVIQSIDDLRAALPKIREDFRWVQELPIIWSRDLDYYLIKLGQFMAEPLENKSDQELWSFIQQIVAHGAQYFQPNIAISITHGTLYRLVHGLLRMVCGGDDANRLFDALFAHCETKTGIVNKELFELARLARLHPELHAILAGTESRAVMEQGVLARFPEFLIRFAKFLVDHGHREMDFDMYQPTWIEVPWVVLDNLKLMLQMPAEPTPAQKEREHRIQAQAAEFELLSRLPKDLHFFFHEILRLTRAYVSLDDLEHYQTTRLTLALRRGLREFGKRLVTRGIIDEPMDIFFAGVEQINSALQHNDATHWNGFGLAIRNQKAAYLLDKARRPEWILGADTQSAAPDGDVLTGLAGSAGTAEGSVFIVLTPEDFAVFPKGAVLVARTTNPTWTPLFYSAAAVITESGGPLSHGAVTAREMRIPAVMSVQQCLTALKNGQKVRVDGTHGKVHLLA